MASEVQDMRKKVVQMEDQAFNGVDSIFVINVLTELKRACDYPRIHKDAAVWLFQNFLNSPAFEALKMRLILTSNDVKKHKGTIASCAGVGSHLLRPYATDFVIAKTDEVRRNLTQGSVMPRDVFQK